MYKIVPEATSFEPSKVYWKVYKRYCFFFWEYILIHRTKEEAIETVNALIKAGDPIYIEDKS